MTIDDASPDLVEYVRRFRQIRALCTSRRCGTATTVGSASRSTGQRSTTVCSVASGSGQPACLVAPSLPPVAVCQHTRRELAGRTRAVAVRTCVRAPLEHSGSRDRRKESSTRTILTRSMNGTPCSCVVLHISLTRRHQHGVNLTFRADDVRFWCHVSPNSGPAYHISRQMTLSFFARKLPIHSSTVRIIQRKK